MTAHATSARPGVWRAYRSLVGVAVFAGLVIAAVFEATAPRIAANRAEKLAAAMALMLPRVHSWDEYTLDDANLLVAAAADRPATIYAVYDADRALLGFAIKAQVMGYQDRIVALYGYDPFATNVVGLEVLASLETPGLGSRIATDAKFRANFHALDVSLDRSGQRLANPILVVPEGSRRQSWEIDAITGATVSSRAIGKLLNTSATSTLPVIHQNLERLRDG